MSSLLKSSKHHRAFRIEMSKSDDITLKVKKSMADAVWSLVDLRNLSLTGLGFKGQDFHEMDERIECLITFQDDEFLFPGNITRRTQDDSSSELIYGLEFEQKNHEISGLFIEKLISTFGQKRLKQQFLELLLNERNNAAVSQSEQISIFTSLFLEMQKYGGEDELITIFLLELKRLYHLENAFLFSFLDQKNLSKLEFSSSSNLKAKGQVESSFLRKIGSMGSHIYTYQDLDMRDNLWSFINIQEDHQVISIPLFDQSGISFGHLLMTKSCEGPSLLENDHNGAEFIGLILSIFLSSRYQSQGIEPIKFLNPHAPRKYVLIGEHDSVGKMRKFIATNRKASQNISIFGEKGTGKTLFAQILHAEGARSLMPFGEIDCGEIINEDFQLLLGNCLKESSEGTILLKEANQLNKIQQNILWNSLRESCSTTIISTFSKELDHDFHQGLKELLVQERIKTTPLKERESDIPLLINFFMKRECEKRGLITKRFCSKMMEAFLEHSWPGNVFELERMVERSVLYNPGLQVINQFPSGIVPLYQFDHPQAKVYRELSASLSIEGKESFVEEFEQTLIYQYYEELGQDVQTVAKALDISLEKVQASLEQVHKKAS